MNLDTYKLKIEMARKELNTSDLAKLSGISKHTITSYLENRRNPSIKFMGKLANTLKVDVTELLMNEDVKKE